MKINPIYPAYTPKIAFKKEYNDECKENFESYKDSLANLIVTKRNFITSNTYNLLSLNEKFRVSTEESYNFAFNTLKDKIKESENDVEIARAYKQFFLANNEAADMLYAKSAKYNFEIPDKFTRLLQREIIFNKLLYHVFSAEENLLSKTANEQEILSILISSTIFALAKLEGKACKYALQTKKIDEILGHRLALLLDRSGNLNLNRKIFDKAGMAFDEAYLQELKNNAYRNA